MHTITKKDVVLKPRRKRSHKGQHGRVLVIGGSPQYVGAVTLAGLAALHNCDLVVVAAPEKVAWAINTYTPDLITVKLKGATLQARHYAQLKPYIEQADVLLFGNGAGMQKGTQQLMRKLALLPCKKVIDADGINALHAMPQNAILTPHQREYDLLTKRLQHDIRTAIPKDTVVLLKGATDTIISRTKQAKNKTGNPGMTKGGTGDVLAGLAAGYFTQLDAWHAACNAAYMNGMVGDVLQKKRGYTYLASDLVAELQKLS